MTSPTALGVRCAGAAPANQRPRRQRTPIARRGICVVILVYRGNPPGIGHTEPGVRESEGWVGIRRDDGLRAAAVQREDFNVIPDGEIFPRHRPSHLHSAVGAAHPDWRPGVGCRGEKFGRGRPGVVGRCRVRVSRRKHEQENQKRSHASAEFKEARSAVVPSDQVQAARNHILRRLAHATACHARGAAKVAVI